MITYSYSEYSPEDDNQFGIDRLMSILSDMIMKYDISLEEALKLLIEKGVPANLFLKEAGMNDLVQKYIEKIIVHKGICFSLSFALHFVHFFVSDFVFSIILFL